MISPRFVSGIRCKPCDCRMANPSHTGIIAIPPPAQRLCSCRAESGCPNPPVVTDLTGGHLALSVRMDEYVDAVRVLIESRTERA